VAAVESTPYRTKIIRVATLLGGLYFFLYFVLPETVLEDVGIVDKHDKISNGFIAIGAMAIGLGLINLVASHGAKVAFRRAGWINSLALLVGLVSMLVVTAGQWVQGLSVTADIRKVQLVSEFAQRIIDDEEAMAATQGASPRAVPPLSERVTALTRYTREVLGGLEGYSRRSEAFNGQEARRVLLDELRANSVKTEEAVRRVESESWTAFGAAKIEPLIAIGQESNKIAGSYFVLRRLDREETLIQRLYDLLYNGLFNQLGSAMFALLGVYIAAAAYRAFRVKTMESALMMIAAVIVMLGQISFGRTIYEEMPAIRQWLLEVPNSAAFRAIRLGAGVAGLMLAIRMWLSIESKSFSSRKK
jgi:hypothetical protein